MMYEGELPRSMAYPPAGGGEKNGVYHVRRPPPIYEDRDRGRERDWDRDKGGGLPRRGRSRSRSPGYSQHDREEERARLARRE